MRERASVSRSSGAAVGGSSKATSWSEVVCVCAWRRVKATAASRAVTAAGVRHCRAACTGVGMAGIGFVWAWAPSVKMRVVVYCSRFSVSVFSDLFVLDVDDCYQT